MTNDAAFYRARAQAEQANAAAATLDNVRDRCERAALAWAQMASRAEHTRDQRIEREGAAARARVDAMLDLVPNDAAHEPAIEDEGEREDAREDMGHVVTIGG